MGAGICPFTPVSGQMFVSTMLSTDAIKKFQMIYAKEFGEDLDFETASEMASRLLNLAKVICAPMPKHFESRYRELLKEQTKKTTTKG